MEWAAFHCNSRNRKRFLGILNERNCGVRIAKRVGCSGFDRRISKARALRPGCVLCTNLYKMVLWTSAWWCESVRDARRAKVCLTIIDRFDASSRVSGSTVTRTVSLGRIIRPYSPLSGDTKAKPPTTTISQSPAFDRHTNPSVGETMHTILSLGRIDIMVGPAIKIGRSGTAKHGPHWSG